MALDTAAILAQIDDLLGEFQEAKAASPYDDLSGGLPMNEMQAIATRLRAGIKRLSPPESAYSQGADAAKGHIGFIVLHLAGVLQALRADVAAGYTERLVDLIHADLFADFLAMASELQHGGFKDAAAVIAGSALEEHLRKLAAKSQISTMDAKGQRLKASRLNDELRDAGIYNPLHHRSVQAWLDIRNAAAHANYGEYDHAQVASLIQSVGDFMVRHPA